MSDRQAGTVVTSENLAEFQAQKLGLAAPEAPTEATVEETPAEPVAEQEQSEPEAETKAEATEEKKQNPKLEKRFSELTKQREAARAEAQREREAREALETRMRELEQKVVPKQVDPAAEPTPDQFNDAFEYAKALAEWSADKALRERDIQEAERRAAEARDKMLKSWQERLETTKREVPDYQEMIDSSDVMVSDQVRDAILESEVGPRILYHLAENPEFARKLSDMSVISALREIGKLEAKYEVTSKPTTPVVKTKAPAPINPLKATGSALDNPIGTDGQFYGTYQQWKEARRAGKIK